MMQFEAKVFMKNILILLRYHELLSDLYSSYVLDVVKILVKLRLKNWFKPIVLGLNCVSFWLNL